MELWIPSRFPPMCPSCVPSSSAGPLFPLLSFSLTHARTGLFFFLSQASNLNWLRAKSEQFKSKSRSICLSPFLFLPSFESSQWRPQQVRRRRHFFLLRRRHRRWRAEWRKGATIICISNSRVRILRLHSRRPGERGFVRPRRGSAGCPLAPPARGAPFTEESPGFLLYFIITPLLLLLKKEFNLFCLFFFLKFLHFLWGSEMSFSRNRVRGAPSWLFTLLMKENQPTLQEREGINQ